MELLMWWFDGVSRAPPHRPLAPVLPKRRLLVSGELHPFAVEASAAGLASVAAGLASAAATLVSAAAGLASVAVCSGSLKVTLGKDSSEVVLASPLVAAVPLVAPLVVAEVDSVAVVEVDSTVAELDRDAFSSVALTSVTASTLALPLALLPLALLPLAEGSAASSVLLGDEGVLDSDCFASALASCAAFASASPPMAAPTPVAAELLRGFSSGSSPKLMEEPPPGGFSTLTALGVGASSRVSSWVVPPEGWVTLTMVTNLFYK